MVNRWLKTSTGTCKFDGLEQRSTQWTASVPIDLSFPDMPRHIGLIGQHGLDRLDARRVNGFEQEQCVKGAKQNAVLSLAYLDQAIDEPAKSN
jgi:hypothetical protein